MKINNKDLAEILLSVISELSVTQGGRVARSTLYEAWRKTGFRQRDVDVALEAAVASGYLGAGEVRGHESVHALTDVGAHKAMSSSATFSSLFSRSQRLRRQAERRLVKPRVLAPDMAANAGRRRSDRMAAIAS